MGVFFIFVTLIWELRNRLKPGRRLNTALGSYKHGWQMHMEGNSAEAPFLNQKKLQIIFSLKQKRENGVKDS